MLWLGSLGCRASGCLGTNLDAEVDGQHFKRCAQAEPPAARQARVGGLSLTIAERVLTLEGVSSLRIAAFTGPVGGRLERADLEQLRNARPQLVLYLGGLGDDEPSARANLSSLSALHVPVLFVAGGADRLAVVEAAFAALGEGERDTLLHASGLRELRFGNDRFVFAAGAAMGRYALDAESCGLLGDDLETIQAAASDNSAARTWLVSWQAPTGYGVSTGFGGTELGSPDLQSLAASLGASGGLFAYPESRAGEPRLPGLALVVPRLSRVGVQRADGSRLSTQVASLVLTAEGLLPSP